MLAFPLQADTCIRVLADDSDPDSSDNYIRSTSFSADGKLLATGSEDKTIRIWNIAQRRIIKSLKGHNSEIYSLAFSPDGKRLVSGSGDCTAMIWDIESGTCVYRLENDDKYGSTAEGGSADAGVTSVVLSPDGALLAAGSLDTIVRLWDARTGELIERLSGHKNSVYSVAFSPDGKFLVSASLDKTLKMWDVQPFRQAIETSNGASYRPSAPGESKVACTTTLQGHKDYVLSVAVSPDGQWIVSGSKDRGVQFWDPATAKAQFMLQGHKNSGPPSFSHLCTLADTWAVSHFGCRFGCRRTGRDWIGRLVGQDLVLRATRLTFSASS